MPMQCQILYRWNYESIPPNQPSIDFRRTRSVESVCGDKKGGRKFVGGRGSLTRERNEVTPRRGLHCSDGVQGNLIVADTPKHQQGSSSVLHSIQNTLRTALQGTSGYSITPMFRVTHIQAYTCNRRCWVMMSLNLHCITLLHAIHKRISTHFVYLHCINF